MHISYTYVRMFPFSHPTLSKKEYFLKCRTISLYLAFMWLLSCVDQVVFLQVGQLSEVLVAGLTPEWTLSTVYSQMDLRTACQS